MTRLKMKRALIVEDEESARELLREMLEPFGYEIEEAPSGEEGLERARALRPDLILLDVNLPGMDGFEVCRFLKASPELQGVPVLMLTGAAVGIKEQVKGLGLGAEDYVLKPFRSDVLAAKIRVITGRVQAPAMRAP